MRRSLLSHFGISIPIFQAPMAGACDADLAIAVCNAGGLGALPCAMLSPEQVLQQARQVREHTNRPFNLNFFCHQPPEDDNPAPAAWREALAPFYRELGIEQAGAPAAVRRPFDEEMCQVVEQVRPAVASFHFGLPADDLLERVRAAGCLVISSATTSAEAAWLEQKGVDAVIAQGWEAGGHRGVFLDDSVNAQPGSMALTPRVVDTVDLPVIAAGGIADGRAMAAALALGASAVQIGTSYLFSNEARISELHRNALENADDGSTAVSNVYTGRPARGVINRVMSGLGPISDATPPFPLAAAQLAPLRTASEAEGKADFTPLWSGQGVGLGSRYSGKSATEITHEIYREAMEVMAELGRMRGEDSPE